MGCRRSRGTARRGRSDPDRAPRLKLASYASSRFITGAVAGLIAQRLIGVTPSQFGGLLVATLAAALVAEVLDMLFASVTARIRGSSIRGLLRTLSPLLLTSVPLYAPIVAVLALAYTEVSPWTASVEYVNWWLRRGYAPPALTTSSPASQGILDRPDTHVLYGDDRLETRHHDRLRGLLRKLRGDHVRADNVRLFTAQLHLADGNVEPAAQALEAVQDPATAPPHLHRLWAEIHRRRGQVEQAFTAYAHDTGSVPHYQCTVCQRSAPEWIGYCPQCRRWDSYRAAVEIGAP